MLCVQSVDLLLVLGSALNVQPMASIPAALPRGVAQVLVNGEALADAHQFDVEVRTGCEQRV